MSTIQCHNSAGLTALTIQTKDKSIDGSLFLSGQISKITAFYTQTFSYFFASSFPRACPDSQCDSTLYGGDALRLSGGSH